MRVKELKDALALFNDEELVNIYHYPNTLEAKISAVCEEDYDQCTITVSKKRNEPLSSQPRKTQGNVVYLFDPE